MATGSKVRAVDLEDQAGADDRIIFRLDRFGEGIEIRLPRVVILVRHVGCHDAR